MNEQQKAKRFGNITSSDAVLILSVGKRDMTEEELAAHKLANPKSKAKKIESWPGQACITYIRECNEERKLLRSIANDSNSKPTSWGKLVETRIANLLGHEYQICSDVTLDHPTIPFWKGSPDCAKDDEGLTVGDIKCPMTLKSFAALVRPLYDGLNGMVAMNALRKGWTDSNGDEWDEHPDGEKYYQQLVSNSCITGAKYGELIIYAPYKSEIQDIIDSAGDYDGNPNEVAWLNWATPDQLPWIPDGGYYKNINIIRFEIDQRDKDLLTEKILVAGSFLRPFLDKAK